MNYNSGGRATVSIHEYTVLGIAGSIRAGSANRGLLREASRLLPSGMKLEFFDLAPIPLFNEDVRVAGTPESVKELKRRLAAADGILFSVAEYNYSLSGVLKNAIDWASRPVEESPLAGKPIAIMGAGGGLGTARAQYHLRQVAVFTDMLPMNKPELMVSKSWERFDKEGNLLDETVRPQLQAFLAAFSGWISAVQAGRPQKG